MDPTQAPLIRLEVQVMKETMKHALVRHQEHLSEEVLKAVDDYCTEENITRIIDDAARTALQEAIKIEVREFFTNGNGRKAVAMAVRESLLKRETYTPLDDVPTPGGHLLGYQGAEFSETKPGFHPHPADRIGRMDETNKELAATTKGT